MVANGSGRALCRVIGPVLAVALLGGCAVGPDFFVPPAPKMDRWLKSAVAAYAEYEGVTEQRAPPMQWWRLFKDPTLDKLVGIARAQNLTLEAAGIRIFEARAQLAIVMGDRYPQSQAVGAGYKTERVSKNVGIVKEVSKVVDFDPTFHEWQAGFDAGWELDIWGQVRRGIQAATANLVARIADFDDILVTLTGDVATSYVAIRALQQELILLRRNVALQAESLRITQLRLQNGVTTELDVNEATILLNNTKAAIPSVETDLAKAKNALAVLLGQPPGTIDKLVGRPGAIPRPPAEVAIGIPVELLRRRPDIRAAEMRAAAQAAQIGVAAADLYPSFTISGAIGVKASDLSDLFQGKSLTGLLNPGITWNILNYGRIKNNVRVQDARYQESIVAYQNTVLRAYVEVEDALAGFLNAKQEAVFLARAVAAAGSANRIATAQYTDGAASYTRVLNAQQELVRAESRLTSVRADVVTNLIAVYKGLGGGWEGANYGPFIAQSTKDEMALRTSWGRGLDESAIPAAARELQAPPNPR